MASFLCSRLQERAVADWRGDPVKRSLSEMRHRARLTGFRTGLMFLSIATGRNISGVITATREDERMQADTLTIDTTPNWVPLERAVSPVQLADFMHMGRIGTMELYKHRWTRRYLNIDALSGDCFEYRDGEYLLVDPECAMRYVLEAP